MISSHPGKTCIVSKTKKLSKEILSVLKQPLLVGIVWQVEARDRRRQLGGRNNPQNIGNLTLIVFGMQMRMHLGRHSSPVEIVRL